MAFIIPTAWSAGSYSTGTQRIYNGVLYEVVSSSDTNARPDLSNDWKVIAVHQIQDYNSLVEAVRLNLNVDDDEINRSVPLFVQLAEESFKTRIRVPQQRKRAILTADADGKIEAPGDLLEVINLRQNSNNFPSVDIRSRGVIEILNGNYENYQRLIRFQTGNDYVGDGDINAFDAPIYWFDNRYFRIAPLYDAGTEFELWYYALIRPLGSTYTDTNSQVQTVTQNWYTAAAPQMLLYGALCKAESYLKDPDRIAMWKQSFEEAQAETQDMINRFEDSQPHTLFIENAYSSRI